MADKRKKTKENFYILPMHILNIKEIKGDQKLLLIHIYSFGTKGCWQSNETLAKIFNTSPGTISRWITKIKKYLYVKCPKGYHRTLWAKSHPDVREAANLRYHGYDISKRDTISISNNDKDVKNKSESDCCKSEIPPEQKCATTNNTTNKDTIEETIEPLSLLPAAGQASAALEERTQDNLQKIAKFKKKFGLGQNHEQTYLSEEETHNRAQKQIKALGVKL